MNISDRLNAIADMTDACSVLCDIGTDHAYVPIKLVLDGKAERALAMDIGKGPLDTARANIVEAGLEDRIETRLSDGLDEYRSGEADSILIAGMGGELIIDILKRGRDKLRSGDKIIVSPHTHLSDVRRFLRTEGFRTTDEKMIVDNNKYYTIIKTEYSPGYSAQASDTEDIFGSILIRRKDPVLKAYLEKEKKKFDSIVNYLNIIKEAEDEMY